MCWFWFRRVSRLWCLRTPWSICDCFDLLNLAVKAYCLSSVMSWGNLPNVLCYSSWVGATFLYWCRSSSPLPCLLKFKETFAFAPFPITMLALLISLYLDCYFILALASRIGEVDISGLSIAASNFLAETLLDTGSTASVATADEPFFVA